MELPSSVQITLVWLQLDWQPRGGSYGVARLIRSVAVAVAVTEDGVVLEDMVAIIAEGQNLGVPGQATHLSIPQA